MDTQPTNAETAQGRASTSNLDQETDWGFWANLLKGLLVFLIALLIIYFISSFDDPKRLLRTSTYTRKVKQIKEKVQHKLTCPTHGLTRYIHVPSSVKNIFFSSPKEHEIEYEERVWFTEEHHEEKSFFRKVKDYLKDHLTFLPIRNPFKFNIDKLSDLEILREEEKL